LELSGDVQTRGPRHLYIGNEYVGLMYPDHSKRLGPIARLCYDIYVGLE
jgi:hypothetical protein